MKKILSFENIVLAVIATLSVTALATMLTGCAETGASLAMAGVVIGGASGGKHVVDGPLTTDLTREASPELLRNEIDERVTKIRPYATPIDQISRCAGSRLSGSMIVDYYSVDTKSAETTLAVAVTASTTYDSSSGQAVYTLSTKNDNIFEPTDTILVPTCTTTADSQALVLYVVSRDTSGLKVIAVNGKPSSDNAALKLIAPLAIGVKLVRMGRAAGELDVQTAQFNALPVKSQNYCQIFKAQVEESTYQSISNKEVGWNFSDQEEVAIMDLRSAMERNFLFGRKARITDPVKGDEVMLTGGIWDQAENTYEYKTATTDTDFIVDLAKKAFTGNCGSNRKIIVGGSDLIARLNKMDATKVLSSTETFTHWGIDFKELHSKFGTFYVIHSEVFDSCGHAADGMVIDPEYLTKYVHVPFRTERLDLKKSGQRNTNAVVITEASCLVLRYPKAHLRISYSE